MKKDAFRLLLGFLITFNFVGWFFILIQICYSFNNYGIITISYNSFGEMVYEFFLVGIILILTIYSMFFFKQYYKNIRDD